MTQLDINKAAKDYRELQGMIRELENEAEAIKTILTTYKGYIIIYRGIKGISDKKK